ncbi:hypothetical protein OGZ02_06955 [Brachyspira hyodysenteriae]|nr:hypothetical protein [Brachyspira hyodysenteriae]MDA1468582.1 hypothetical protein [Brachyspira hyodysenteriae]
MISSVTNEPYFSLIEAVEDCELLEIKIENINKIDNHNIIKKYQVIYCLLLRCRLVNIIIF